MYFHKDSPFLLLSFLLCVTLGAAKQCNSCVRLNDSCFRRTHLFDFQGEFRNEVVITKLGILYSQDRLYYEFQPKISDSEYYKIGFVDLTSPENQGVIKGKSPVTNFKTFDIDQNNEVIYLGSSNGIFKINFKRNATDHFSSIGDTIEDLVFKANVFFIRYGENVIFEKEQDVFKGHEKIKNVKMFVIDRNYKVVYLNTTGLYASSNIDPINDNDIVRLSKNSFFRGLTTDKHGDVYAWYIDGIYKVELKSNIQDSAVVKIAEITGIGAVTFDKDNKFLFTSGKSLFRLDPLPMVGSDC